MKVNQKRSYYEDIELFRSNVVFGWVIAFLVFLFTFPIYAESYTISVVNLMMVNVIVVVGLNMLIGNTGQISLGHAGFFAIGCYTTAILMTKANIPFIFALPMGGLLAAVFGFIVGLPALRLEGPYLAIATIAFGLAIMHIIGHVDVCGGRMGLSAPALVIGIPGSRISWILKSDKELYFLILIITVLMIAGAKNILDTRPGRCFVAIRDSDVAAEVIGVNLMIYKTLAFAVSAFYAGIGGGLYGFVISFFDPSSFTILLSIIFLAMVVVGGLGSITGSIMGAVFITFLEYQLLSNVREVPVLGNILVYISRKWFVVLGLENFSNVALGAIMIVIILFEPLGLFGVWLRIKQYWKTWPL